MSTRARFVTRDGWQMFREVDDERAVQRVYFHHGQPPSYAGVQVARIEVEERFFHRREVTTHQQISYQRIHQVRLPPEVCYLEEGADANYALNSPYAFDAPMHNLLHQARTMCALSLKVLEKAKELAELLYAEEITKGMTAEEAANRVMNTYECVKCEASLLPHDELHTIRRDWESVK